MKKFSILLPSRREVLIQSRINDFISNSDVPYELIIVSPFEVKHQSVKWIKDEPPFKGSVYATNKALSVATGDYIIYFSDDVKMPRGSLKQMYNFMESHEDKLVLGAFKMVNNLGIEIGPFGAYKKLYACYGCISKQNLLKLKNILFRPEFLYSWVDIDLSLRIWELGGEVIKSETATVIPNQVDDLIYREHREKYWDMDVNTFMNKWHDKLGQGLEKDHAVINRRMGQ